MVAFVFALLLIIGGVVTIIAGKRADYPAMSAGGAVGIIIAILLLLWSSSTIVPTKQVGIPVTYGKAGTPLQSGFHWVAPWTDVVIMDATVQDVDNAGDNPTQAKDATDSDVFVHNLVRWSIQPDAASSLYGDYKTFDRLTSSLVEPEIKTAVASVMREYDPLSNEKPGLDTLSDTIKDRLEERLGDRIQVQSVSVSLVNVSETTQGRINALNAEKANTEVAAQKAQTAEKQAEANRIIAQSVTTDPNVLVDQCIKAVADSDPGTFPVGFQCWSSTDAPAVVR